MTIVRPVPAASQTPLLHNPLAHGMPQPPQLSGSTNTLMHCRPHTISSAVHTRQVLSLQTPEAQMLLQVPQFSGSAVRSTHWLLQMTVESVHTSGPASPWSASIAVATSPSSASMPTKAAPPSSKLIGVSSVVTWSIAPWSTAASSRMGGVMGRSSTGGTSSARGTSFVTATSALSATKVPLSGMPSWEVSRTPPTSALGALSSMAPPSSASAATSSPELSPASVVSTFTAVVSTGLSPSMGAASAAASTTVHVPATTQRLPHSE